MPIGSVEVGEPKLVTATGNILPRDGAMLGFFVANATTATLILYDSATTTTTTPLTGTLTLAAGWYFLPIIFQTGLYAVITGTTSITFAVL